MELFDKNIMALDGMSKTRGLLMMFAFADALLVIGQALGLAQTLAALWQLAGNGHVEIASQALPITVFALCYLVRQLLHVVRSRMMERAAAQVSRTLLHELMATLHAAGPALVRRFGAGSLTDEAAEGIAHVRSYIELTLPKSVDLMVVSTVLAVALLVLDWVSGVIAIVMIPCIVFFMRLLGENSKRAAAKQHGEYERLTNHFADILSGFPTIKLFGRSASYEQLVYGRSEALRSATIKTLRTVTLSSLVIDLFRVFALAAVAIMLGFRLMAGSVALFNALAVLIIVPELFAAIRRYSADFHATLEGKNQLAAIVEVLNAGKPAREMAALQDARVKTIAPWGSSSTMHVRNLSVTHSAESGDSWALHDVDFEVAGSCKVGIVGASGAGKSTLATLLAGFAAPDAGTRPFVIDGCEYEHLMRDDWRAQATFIPQDPHIFHATLRENIAFYCPDADETSVMRAVRAVGLDGLVEDLDSGIETVVGQGARQLSGGQAQRVALARALLDPKRRIWIFDEPTAHLDIETELALKEQMLPMFDERLVFFATHRLHWMRDMDVLVVLEDGKLVQFGSYDELLAKEGAFADLVAALRGGGAS